MDILVIAHIANNSYYCLVELESHEIDNPKVQIPLMCEGGYINT